MSTLDEARNEMDFVSAQEVLSENFTLEVLEALNVCVRGVSRAVAEDVYAGKEAERRQKLDDLKRSIGVPVYDEDDSEPFKPGEDHSYYGGPGYENATAEQCADLDRRFAAATSPTDTGARGARHFFEQPGDKNYAELVAKAGAEIDAEVIAERDATIADLEQRLAEAEGRAQAHFAASMRAHRQWYEVEVAARDAERERDAARAALEAMERRVGELEGKYQEEYRAVANVWKALDLSEEQRRQFRHIAEWVTGIKVERDAAEKRVGDLEEALRKIEQQTHWTGLYCSLFARAALTPDAGTARSDGEGK